MGETRSIAVETGHEPLGIQIDPGRDGGIFVSAVGENCRASRAGIAVGDQLLEVGIYSFYKTSTLNDHWFDFRCGQEWVS